MYASKTIENLKGENFDQTTGISIVRKALSVPCKTIAENAGKEGGIIAANLLAQKDENIGYNASTDQYVDMFKAGIIDPFKVVRHALIDAASVAGLMITTECMIVEKKEPKENAPPQGGMGGMGGMY